MDSFLSGTSDVVLPEGGGRRPGAASEQSETDLESRAPYFCERCDESIPLAALAAGRARLVYGLPFCVRCAPLLEEERYQIYFCDRCGVSIPLERVEGGEALAGDGHVYCVRCRRRRPRIVRRAVVPVLALLAAGALATFVPGLLTPSSPRAVGLDLEGELRDSMLRLDRRLSEIEIESRRRRSLVEKALRDLEREGARVARIRGQIRALEEQGSAQLPSGRDR